MGSQKVDIKKIGMELDEILDQLLQRETPDLISCSHCDGTGQIEDDKCDYCWGTGLVSEQCSICDTDESIDLDTPYICSDCAQKFGT